jgi:hypothetical protein
MNGALICLRYTHKNLDNVLLQKFGAYPLCDENPETKAITIGIEQRLITSIDVETYWLLGIHSPDDVDAGIEELEAESGIKLEPKQRAWLKNEAAAKFQEMAA